MVVSLDYKFDESAGLAHSPSVSFYEDGSRGIRFSSVLITTRTLPPPSWGPAYSATITAIGGSESGYAWEIVDGAPPTGLSLAPSGTPSTTLSGTPSALGSFTFTVRVTDDGGNVDEQVYTLVVAEWSPTLEPAIVACDGGYTVVIDSGAGFADGVYEVFVGEDVTGVQCFSGVAGSGAKVTFEGGVGSFVSPPLDIGGPYALTLRRISGAGSALQTTTNILTVVPKEFRSGVYQLRALLPSWLRVGARTIEQEGEAQS